MTKRKKRVLAVALVLLAGLGIAWACWPSRKLARARQLQSELFARGGSLTAEQRKQKFQELRAVQKQLSPAQRKELGADMRKRRQEGMARFFAMSPKEKERHLDGLIRRQQQMKKSQQARGGQGGAPRGAGGGPATKGDRSPKGRDDRRQRFLDSSSPAERAQMAQFRKELNDRRARLGLPAGGGGRGGPLR